MSLRFAAIVVVTVGCLLAVSAPSAAATRTYTLRSAPIRVGGFETVLPRGRIATPGVNGFIVRMHARLVDARGRPVSVRDVMMHHVFFQRYRRPTTAYPCQGRTLQAFYGTGEEDQRLVLPAGHGYRIRARDRWRMAAMLMSHRARHMTVYLQYRVTVDTSRALTPVSAFWLRANGCRDAGYWIAGDGVPGSIDVRSVEWEVPYDLRIVAAGGHLHGGARDMWLSQPRCNDRRLLDNRPAYGLPDHVYYRARPVLHEPGPVDTRYFLSRTGISLARGDVVRIGAAYNGDRPRTAMAVMHVYVARARERPTTCAPLPSDGRELQKSLATRSEPPTIRVPLTALDARGKTYEPPLPLGPGAQLIDGARVAVGDDGFHPAHLTLASGSTLTWQSTGSVFHNVRLADGPRLVATPTLTPGRTWPTTFTTPGRYTLFCTWHPMTMHGVVDVTG